MLRSAPFWVLFFALLALTARAAPPIPDGAEEGDLVEVDGKFYEVWDGELVALEEESKDAVPAEEDFEDFEDFDKAGVGGAITKTVTGSRVQSKDGSAVRTDVVDRATIEESGARTLSDALQRVGGLQVSSPVGTGDNVSIDGLDGKYVKILIDGRPVNGTVNSRVDISRLPISLADIEKIEIVRGPMSALYGSDAMGGVVNIITQRAKQKLNGDVELTTRLDGEGVQRSSFSARATGGNEYMALKLTGSYLLDRGVDRATRIENDDGTGTIILNPDGILDLPFKRQMLLTGEVSVYPNDDWALRAYGTASSAEVESRFGLAVPFRDHTADTQFQLGVVAEGDLAPLHTLKIDTRIDRFIHRFEKLPDAGQVRTPPFCRHEFGGTFLDAECPAPANVRSIAVQDQVRTEVIYTGVLVEGEPWAEELKLAAGAVLRSDTITRENGDGEDTLPGGGDQLLTALYTEIGYSPFRGLSFAPGARLEATFPGVNDSPVAAAISPRISGRYELPASFAVRASFGNAFRVPDFLERYLRFDHSDLGYIVEGNPGLDTESNNGFRGELLFAPKDNARFGVETFLKLNEQSYRRGAHRALRG